MALPQPPLWTVTVDALCVAWRLVVCGPEHNHWKVRLLHSWESIKPARFGFASQARSSGLVTRIFCQFDVSSPCVVSVVGLVASSVLFLAFILCGLNVHFPGSHCRGRSEAVPVGITGYNYRLAAFTY